MKFEVTTAHRDGRNIPAGATVETLDIGTLSSLASFLKDIKGTYKLTFVQPNPADRFEFEGKISIVDWSNCYELQRDH